MATIRKQFTISTAPEVVWAAFRDFHAVHEKVVRGFVVASQPDGVNVREITFANGVTAREELISCDDDARRLAYTATGGPLTHHNGVVEVGSSGAGSLVTWTLDVLPNEMAPAIEGMMEAGAAAMRATLG